jgi:hypothetical protein
VTNRAWIRLAFCLAAASAAAAPDPGGADQWLARPAQYPDGIAASLVETNRFAALRAEAVAGRFRIVCPAGDLGPQARLSVCASAFAPGQVLAAWPQEASLGEQWQKVDLFFEALPQAPLPAVDLFSIELIAAAPCEFLLDDLEFLVPWRLDSD